MSDNRAQRNRNRKIYSVTQLTRAVRAALEERFSEVWIEGEISNYRAHSSGHHYFTLKDESAQISCVLFRGQARHLNFRLSDGQRVQARGEVTVYEARGQYQLIVEWMQPEGMGELQARFEELKRKLDSEGLFDPERKRPLAPFPATVAVVTSPTGAAIRDILNVLTRRAPWINVLVVPVPVQGAGAEMEIAAAIRSLAKQTGIDTVIVGRGGGGIEDLWNFNEEVVARAIFDCPIPVISAVGHEIDFTIADFVADVRAPTPSAAAELAVPDGAELSGRICEAGRRLAGQVHSRLDSYRQRLMLTRRTLLAHEPRSAVENAIQRIDHLMDRMDGTIERTFDRETVRIGQAGRVLQSWSPQALLLQLGERSRALQNRLEAVLAARMRESGERAAGLGTALRALSPEAIFQRGFSVTFDANGDPITDATSVKAGDRVRTRLARGEFESRVEPE